MISLFKVFLPIILFSTTVNATTYYVTTKGDNSNNGLSESAAWKTIKYAVGQISAGDTLYVKAGTYNGEKISLRGGGILSPILIEGYKNIPGDINNIDWWDFNNNRDLDSTKMPLLDGGNRAKGTAIDINSYTVFKNFQITNYENGIISYYDQHCAVENVIVTKIGDINDSYSGTGIGFYYGSGHHILKNAVVVNAAAEAVMIYKGGNSLLENVKVYCDDNQTLYYSNTDYYFEIESNDNIIRNCYIERVGNLDHVGHGFCIKGDGYKWSGNLFENCVAKNLEGGGFVVRHRSVTNNVFKNCTAYDATGFLIRDGASYNFFYNCKTVGCYSAVRFIDTDEDGGKQYAGRFNNFYNCLFTNSNYVVDFHSYSLNSDANDNRLINCVVNGGNYLFNSQRTNYDNKMINCVVSNVTYYKSGGNVDFDYINTDFWNNGFDIPAGTDLLEVDPKFVDAENGDYQLTEGSNLIDAGTTDTTGLNLPSSDAFGYYRIADGNGDGVDVIDLGISEYNSIPVSVKEEKTKAPTQFVLFQNYPNPFNPSTVISFALPTSLHVKLSVYNMLGERVAELVNSNMSAGNHEIIFNASNLTSGIYVYRISTNNFSSSKKMLMVK